MNQSRMNRWLKKVGLLVGVAAVTALIGHGCSKFSSSGGSGSDMGSTMGTTNGTGAGGGFQPMANTLTVSLIYNKQLLDNMVTCTGIGTPSVQTVDEWQGRQSSFSEYGYATDVTAPMLMAITAVAGEVCNDLLDKEENLSADQRRIYNSVNFAAGVSALNSTVTADMVRRMARACWARNENPDELQIVQDELATALAGVNATDPVQTHNAALMVCTAMLSSLSGITL